MKILNRYNREVIVEKDAETIKELVEYAIEEGISLCVANLYEADLRGADLRVANLYGANLREADLYGAYLYGADLTKANLYEANLYGAYLYGAKGVLTFTAGDTNRLCFTYVYNNEQRWQLGCFNGNYEETLEAVRNKYTEDSHYYKMIIATKGALDETKL